MGFITDVIAPIGGAIYQNAVQNERERRSMENQRQLMDLQQQNQMELNKQGQQIQLDTWMKTSYPAQMKMMKEAGLNPALMYGMGGGGGTTTGGQGGGSAASGSAPAPQQMDMKAIIEAMKLGVEIANTKADTLKKQAETPNIEADTAKKEAETKGQVIKNEIAEASKQDAINIIKQDSAIKSNQSLQTEVETLFDYWVSGGQGNLTHRDGSETYVSESEVKGSERYQKYQEEKRKVEAEADIQKAEAQLNEVLRKYGANNTTVNALMSILRIAILHK